MAGRVSNMLDPLSFGVAAAVAIVASLLAASPPMQNITRMVFQTPTLVEDAGMD
jgi:hypothetical protein